MDIKCGVRTENPVYDTFFDRIKAFMLNDVTTFFVEKEIVKGYRAPDTPPIWVRDHTHQMKGFKYWETEMKSAIDYFLKRQMANGSFYECLHRTLESDEEDYGLIKGLFKINERDRAYYHHRVGVEADVEYLMVEAVYTVWQATGDDEWMVLNLKRLERGLRYCLADKYRWSSEYNLVKRPFTIDTWDFEYGEPPILPSGKKADHRYGIDKQAKFCIMHGDNSGMYLACQLLAKMFFYAGNKEESNYWQRKAEKFRVNTNKVCWNGRFYTHQVHIDPIEVKGVNEEEQLSLSNTYDMNRGLPTHEQCVSIIQEYMRRRQETEAFAEWFSIDPPFPEGSYPGTWGDKPGEFVNGGILPLVGGELAKACFEHGFEEYGLDILLRYQKMISETGQTYIWYYPDGRPGKSAETTLPTDGWGAAAMLYAFMEGLVGIRDNLRLYQEVIVSPRWAITDEQDVRALAEYGASKAYFSYRYKIDRKKHKISIDCDGSGEKATFHLLLPRGMKAESVSCDERKISYKNSSVQDSPYVDFTVRIKNRKVIINLHSPL